MNEILTILQKTGAWLWNQKEKMVLLILVCVFGFRVYQVVSGPPPAPPEGPPPVVAQESPKTPDSRPVPPPKVDYQSLVQRNPFSIYGISSASDGGRDSEPRIDLVLVRIVPWNDGTYRAEIISSQDSRPRRYEEDEPFEGYRVESINPSANTVTVYSSEHGRSFTLQAQEAS